jgi:hypothetical protein
MTTASARGTIGYVCALSNNAVHTPSELTEWTRSSAVDVQEMLIELEVHAR